MVSNEVFKKSVNEHGLGKTLQYLFDPHTLEDEELRREWEIAYKSFSKLEEYVQKRFGLYD